MYSYKEIRNISFPIALSLLAQNIIQITDTVLMGRVGEVEFGAVGLAGIYYLAFFMLAFGFSIGCQIIISRRNGEQQYHKIGTLVIHGILFMLILALVLFLISSFLVKHVLPKAMGSDEVYVAAKTYLDWRTYGFFFSFINTIFRAYYVGIIRTKVLTLNAILMAIINFLAAYGLIFGHFGLPRMEIAGAGLASVIAESSSVVFFVIYTLCTVDLKKYGFRINRIRIKVVNQVLKISIFTMLQYFISLSTWFLFFVAIENHGERDLAITNILRTFYMLFFIPMNALSSTANTLVSNTIGAGKKDEVLPLVYKIAGISLVAVLGFELITALFPQFWISLVVSSSDITLIKESVIPLFVLLLALPICSVGTVFFNSVIGTGNTQIGFVIETSTIVVYLIALWLIVIHWHSSVAVCWTLEIIYWGFQLVLSFLYLKWGHWGTKIV